MQPDHTDVGGTTVATDCDSNVCTFYQVTNGNNYYLQPKCYKLVMDAAHGHLQNFLQGNPILSLEEFVQNAYTMKRYKFLNHIPMGCMFVFVEIDMKGLIPDDK